MRRVCPTREARWRSYTGKRKKREKAHTRALLDKNLISARCIHVDTVVARGNDLVVVTEAHPAIFESSLDRAHAEPEHDRPALAHPDRRLMRPLEAVDHVLGDVVRRDGDVVFPSLRDPAGHPERRRDRGDHTA